MRGVKIEGTNATYLGVGMYLIEPQSLTPEQKAAYEKEMADFRRRLREAKERLKQEVCC
jgi:ABC-type Zn2+ transport system substrate-binding protein/surface adhesin